MVSDKLSLLYNLLQGNNMKPLFLPILLVFFASTAQAMEGEQNPDPAKELKNLKLKLSLIIGSAEFSAMRTTTDAIKERGVDGTIIVDSGERQFLTDLRAQQLAAVTDHLLKLQEMMEKNKKN